MQYIQTGENDLLKRRVYLHLVDATDGISAKTGQTGTAKISINGNTPATSRNSIVEIDSTNLPGDYYLTLDTSELMATGIVMVRFKNGSTAEFVQLVQVMAFDPYTQFGTLSAGGGADVDYKRIQKMISEAVSKIPQPKEMPEPDLTPILKGLAGLQKGIGSIDIPEAKPVDLAPLMTKFEAVLKAIEGKEIPTTDLSPVMNKLEEAAAASEMAKPDMLALKAAVEDVLPLLGRIRDFFQADVEEIKAGINDLKESFDEIPYVTKTIKEKR